MMSIAEKRSLVLLERWKKIAKKSHSKVQILHDCWTYNHQYVVEITNHLETETLLKIEFGDDVNVIVSMHEQVQFDFLWPYLVALHEVVGKRRQESEEALNASL